MIDEVVGHQIHKFCLLIVEPDENFLSVDLAVKQPDQKPTVISVRACPSSDNTMHNEIINFDCLRENLTEKLKLENWIVVTTHQHLYIFNLNKKLSGNLSIRHTISIDIELVAKVFDGTNDSTPVDLQLYRWPQLQDLIEQLSNTAVKREEDFHFECVSVNEQNFKVEDDDGNDQQADLAAFQLRATNVDGSYDFQTCHSSETLTDHLYTTVPPFPGSFLTVKSETELKSAAKPQSTLVLNGRPHRCSDCGK